MGLKTTIDVMLIDKNLSIKIWDKTGVSAQAGDEKWNDSINYSDIDAALITLRINESDIEYTCELDVSGGFDTNAIHSNVGLTLSASDFLDPDGNELEYFPDGVGTFVYKVFDTSVMQNDEVNQYFGFVAEITEFVVTKLSFQSMKSDSVPVQMDHVEYYLALESLSALGAAGYVTEFIEIVDYITNKLN